MIPLRSQCLTLLIALITLCVPLIGSAEDAVPDAASEPASQTGNPPEGPMAGFARLIGGEWQISILRHRFEWGIGNHTVIAKSYDEEGNLASEARWFWHPGEKAIKGYSIDASGQSFAEMTTRFEGHAMINALEIVNPDGTTAAYTGRWIFTDPDHYDWTLFSNGADGETTQVMQATATRNGRSE